jgi:hypothetical protein
MQTVVDTDDKKVGSDGMTKRKNRFTIEESRIIIIRILRKIVHAKRMHIYRNLKGVLYSRKYTINNATGAFEIMSMHIITNYLGNKPLYIRFTIFDYA